MGYLLTGLLVPTILLRYGKRRGGSDGTQIANYNLMTLAIVICDALDQREIMGCDGGYPTAGTSPFLERGVMSCTGVHLQSFSRKVVTLIVLV
jgi:hypothetical protein